MNIKLAFNFLLIFQTFQTLVIRKLFKGLLIMLNFF